jgi:hypothetical protein
MPVQSNQNPTGEQLDMSNMPKPLFTADSISCPLGVHWGGILSIDGVTTLDTLYSNDDAYFSAIKAKLEDENLTATQVMEIESNMPYLQGQMMEYLNNHPVRRYYIRQAINEHLLNSAKVVVSKENFELYFMGKFEAAKKCKCGVDWASNLYGDECAKCGDKRPVD